jgi:hypothetical protein
MPGRDEFVNLRWRVGGKVGRTIYAVMDDEFLTNREMSYEDDILIGVMDTVILAERVVADHNASLRGTSAGS